MANRLKLDKNIATRQVVLIFENAAFWPFSEVRDHNQNKNIAMTQLIFLSIKASVFLSLLIFASQKNLLNL